MLLIQNLIDDAKCYQEVRKLRWPERVCCPRCQSTLINKRGFHNKQPHRQIAQELGLNKDDVQKMTQQLRQGIVVKKNSDAQERD